MVEHAHAYDDTFNSQMPTLNERFNQIYSLVPANTPDLKKEAFRLRYQVYCRENNFESAHNFKDACEVDEYDERSLHTLLLDKCVGSFVGTVRIILPHEYAPEQSFPIQKVCAHPFLSSPKAKTAIEISRFCISKATRPYCRSYHAGNEIMAKTEFLTPFMALGLGKAIVQMICNYGTNDLFAVMEPALLRLLARFGVYFKPIGPLIEYHGMRQPCYSEFDSLLDRVHRERPDVWEIITDEGRLLNNTKASLISAYNYSSFSYDPSVSKSAKL